MNLRPLVATVCFLAAALAAARASGVAQFTEPANPRDTSASLQRGLEFERAGNLGAAEQTMLEAARYDRRYPPAWTLANFYFRQNEPDQFWHWAHRAAERSYDDGRPLLRLATELEDDPLVVTDRLGRRPVLLRTYLDILIGQNRKGAILQVASMLADLRDPADAPRFEALSKRYGKTK